MLVTVTADSFLSSPENLHKRKKGNLPGGFRGAAASLGCHFIMASAQ
jgi:hypothetical protein